MPERYNNTIHKLFLKSKKTIKATLSSITRIRLIIYIEDPKEAFSVDYAYIKDPKEAFSVNYAYIEDTKAEETTVVDIITTSYPVRSNITSIINLDAS